MNLFTTMRATCIGRSLEWRTINSTCKEAVVTLLEQNYGTLRRLDNLARPSSCVALACMSTSQTSRKVGGRHTHDRLGGGAFNGHLLDFSLYLFCTLLMVICCEHKLVQHFHVSARRRSEVLISRATGGVWIILILVQNDPEKTKTKNKTKQNKKHQCLRATQASPKIAVP